MHVALGYQYPSHMLQLMLVATFCHLRLSLKQTNNPCPPPNINKHTNHKSRKTIFLLAFWVGGGGGEYSLWRFNCIIMWFFFSIYLLQSAGPGPQPGTKAPSKYEFFYLIKRQKPASDF